MANTFLWYDLETFGRDPRRTRIAQFAAIRTDEALDPVGEPISLFCQPADDLLPSPEATMITGITPQQARRDGLREADFFARLNEELSVPGTCAVGYNSIRFDDEFIRFGLYRNFHDAYEREWRNGNSRWDLLDVMRLMRALRPEGMQWPLREDGQPSFKLEHLAEANGVRDGIAHEALSDVRALIGVARKMKTAQPRLWDYALRLRDKRYVSGLLDTINGTPLLHVSGKYPASRHCAALVMPLARHPRIDSRVIVTDLDVDPAHLLALDAEGIAERSRKCTRTSARCWCRWPTCATRISNGSALIVPPAWHAPNSCAEKKPWPRRSAASSRTKARVPRPTPTQRCTTASPPTATSGCSRRFAARHRPVSRPWPAIFLIHVIPSCCSVTAHATGRSRCLRLNSGFGTTTAADDWSAMPGCRSTISRRISR
jgi:hypothetical protein